MRLLWVLLQVNETIVRLKCDDLPERCERKENGPPRVDNEMAKKEPVFRLKNLPAGPNLSSVTRCHSSPERFAFGGRGNRLAMKGMLVGAVG